ncbi:MAG: hypothetical protein KME11_11985 [Timaviella obliquedivisa GSE-PSE-MK23-08B]|nr:hypothetical protein [Timaviella obliquedivisa GSE-PSE-MK23-08B]
MPTIYYIHRLLYQYLDRLQSLVAKGTAIKVDPFCDLNAMLDTIANTAKPKSSSNFNPSA